MTTPLDTMREALEFYKGMDTKCRIPPDESPASIALRSLVALEAQLANVEDVEVNNLLHRMNLHRPDIRALPEGSTIAINVTTHRQAADIIKRLQAQLAREPVSERFDALARTLESIHGDAEQCLKRLYDDGISKKARNKVLEDIYRKAQGVRHMYKDHLGIPHDQQKE